MSTPRPARKRFGQNFLVDRRAAARIGEALDPARGEPVLEIGPGRGALTAGLIERAGRIAAVEIDRDLAADLRRRFPAERLVLFEQDVLTLRLDDVPPALGAAAGARLALAGNLPYNISKPVCRMLVEQRRHVARAVLTFQREVADRLTARCGQRDYGPLAILVGLAFEVRRLFDLAPGAFRPRPKVDSRVTRWEPRSGVFPDAGTERALRACLRASFAHPRRTLFNNLRHALADAGDARALLADCAVDGGLRPAAVAAADYLRLAARWPG